MLILRRKTSCKYLFWFKITLGDWKALYRGEKFSCIQRCQASLILREAWHLFFFSSGRLPENCMIFVWIAAAQISMPPWFLDWLLPLNCTHLIETSLILKPILPESTCISWNDWHLSVYLIEHFYTLTINISNGSGGFRGGHNRPPPPLKFVWLCCLLSHFVSECLKNKAQIARESVKNPESFQGPLAGPGPWQKGTSGLELVMCLRAHNLLRPRPPMKILDPPLKWCHRAWINQRPWPLMPHWLASVPLSKITVWPWIFLVPCCAVILKNVSYRKVALP